MFSKRAGIKHRVRIAVVSATVTGVVLALLFAVIVGFVRANAYAQKRKELTTAFASFASPEDPRFDLNEFHEAYPDLTATVRIAARPGTAAVFRFEGERMAITSRFRDQDITVGASLRETNRGLQRLETTLAALWLPLVLVVGGATWFAARSVFRNLEVLSAQALAIGGDDLSERLVTADAAEFGSFATDLNRMLDRIEETVRRGERFATDAAHELRTPLAILRTRLETALLQPRSPEEYAETLRRSVTEIERLTALTESLLRSARGASGPAAPIDLEPVVSEAVDRWTERFVGAGVSLKAQTRPLAAAISPDEARIVLDNLLSNALRYAPAGSTVRVVLDADAEAATLLVIDEGPGVPPELGDAIFDRFVRADDSRNRASGGAGIGLSVCRQIVAARGGRMILAPRVTGAAIGFRFPKSSG